MKTYKCPCCGHEFTQNEYNHCEETGHLHFYCEKCDFEGIENDVITKN